MPTLTAPAAAAPKHTAGPWRVIVSTQQIYGTFTGGAKPIICNLRCPEGMSSIEARANAALISAAPDLLAALRDAVAYMNGYGMSDAEQSILDAARAAIAKALGA